MLQRKVKAFKEAYKGHGNEWFSFEKDIGHSYQLLCSGIQLQQPQIAFKDGRFVVSTKLQPGAALNIDGYCDNQAEELKL